MIVATRGADDRILSRLGRGDFRVSARWRAVPGFAGLVSSSGLAKLTADPLVERVDLDVGGRGSDAESFPLIRADEAQAAGFFGVGTTVAVLDSGVDRMHPDLRDRVVDEHCFCRNSDGSGCCAAGTPERGGPGSARDDHGHGTHVTGIIASAGTVAPVGVAPAAKVVSVKVLDEDNVFSTGEQIVSALDWVIWAHPEVRVVNMSLGTSLLFSGFCDDEHAFTRTLAAAIRTLREREALVFVSSGNDGRALRMGAPACIREAIAVGAVWDANVGRQDLDFFECVDPRTRADLITCFSNSGPALDLLGPGAPIVSTDIGGGTTTFFGTSQACPHVAGAAALLMSASPMASADAIEYVLKTKGVPIRDPRNGLTRRRIDVAAALERLGTSAAPEPAPKLAVWRPRTTFGRVERGSTYLRIVTLANRGNAPLRLVAVSRPAAPFALERPALPKLLRPGGEIKLRIELTVRRAAVYRAGFDVTWEDLTSGRRRTLPLRLIGTGV